MMGQDKATEQKFYDDLFRQRGRFDQFQSNDLYRLVAQKARQATKGTVALDIGCGSGTQSICLMEEGFSVVSADLSFEAVRIARANLEKSGRSLKVLNADVEHLPFPDDSVDACICSLFLHHFTNLEGVAAELQRVVRPGGIVVANDANAHNPFVYLYFNVVHKIRPLHWLTPNQRALKSDEIREVFGRFGFSDFQFTSVTTDLKRDWLGKSFAFTLNFYARALVMKLSNIVLTPIARGNGLISVFRKSANV